ncbi:phage tail protein [Bradyrhizobium sp. CAR08]
MALDVFTPIHNPSKEGTRRAVKRRVNTAQFGDGYSQRSGDGLNASPRTFTASWSALAAAEAQVYEDFFDAHKSTPFLWTPPLEVAQRKWIAGDSDQGYLGGSTVSLTCTLTEVFDV